MKSIFYGTKKKCRVWLKRTGGGDAKHSRLDGVKKLKNQLNENTKSESAAPLRNMGDTLVFRLQKKLHQLTADYWQMKSASLNFYGFAASDNKILKGDERFLNFASTKFLFELRSHGKTYDLIYKIFKNSVQKIISKNEKMIYDLNVKLSQRLDTTATVKDGKDEREADLSARQAPQAEKPTSADRVRDLLRSNTLVAVKSASAEFTSNSALTGNMLKYNANYVNTIYTRAGAQYHLILRRFLARLNFENRERKTNLFNSTVHVQESNRYIKPLGVYHFSQGAPGAKTTLVYVEKPGASQINEAFTAGGQVETTGPGVSRNVFETIKENHMKEYISREVYETVKKVGFEKLEARFYDLLEEKLSIEMERRG